MIRVAAPMHDVGKVAVPDSVLLKPGPLDPQERADMQRHTVIGHDVLAGSDTEVIQLAASIALTHHERFDGAGYPAGQPARRSPSRAGSPRWRTSSTRSPATGSTAARYPWSGRSRWSEWAAAPSSTRRSPTSCWSRWTRSSRSAGPRRARGRLALGVLRPVHRPVGVLQNPAGVSGPSPLSAMPMLASNPRSSRSPSVGSRSAAFTRSTSCSASGRPVTFSRTSTNSSPPHRATVSLGRTAPRIRRPRPSARDRRPRGRARR